ncbi:MAG TPA: CHRD domain-containing protein [Reyranella sp.]|nr:CHRD domain-containing protein [Reyranella sp.]
MTKTILAGVAFSALLAFASTSFAAVIEYGADLKASSEVPANASTGTGQLVASYDTATKKLSYAVIYSGLTGNATMAHFHGPAAAGANAGVVVPVKEMTPNTLRGEATLTDAQAADLAAGKWYFNIHTAANKGGEIRGQVLKK